MCQMALTHNYQSTFKCNPLTRLEFDSHDINLARVSQQHGMLGEKDISKKNPYCKLSRGMTHRVLTSDGMIIVTP